MMAKYLATSLAMLNVVSAPRVISICLPVSTTSRSLVGLESRSTMLPASLAAWVPVFMATATSACARAGASLVPSPVMAMSRPSACRSRISLSFISGGFGADGGGGEWVVARDHDGLDAHAAKLSEPVADPALHDVLELDHPEHLGVVRHDKRGAAGLGDGVHHGPHVRGYAASQSLYVGLDGIGCALADLSPVQVHPAHPRLGAELHELRPHGLHVPLAQAVLFLGEDHDASSLRRLVGQ